MTRHQSTLSPRSTASDRGNTYPACSLRLAVHSVVKHVVDPKNDKTLVVKVGRIPVVSEIAKYAPAKMTSHAPPAKTMRGYAYAARCHHVTAFMARIENFGVRSISVEQSRGAPTTISKARSGVSSTAGAGMLSSHGILTDCSHARRLRSACVFALAKLPTVSESKAAAGSGYVAPVSPVYQYSMVLASTLLLHLV